MFGFYATSVLLKLSRGISLKAAVEGLILGQFVFTQVRTLVRRCWSTPTFYDALQGQLSKAIMTVLQLCVVANRCSKSL